MSHTRLTEEQLNELERQLVAAEKTMRTINLAPTFRLQTRSAILSSRHASICGACLMM